LRSATTVLSRRTYRSRHLVLKMRRRGAREFGFTTTNGSPNRPCATLGANGHPTGTQQGSGLNLL
jgi:hypothetical protein